MVTCSDSGTAAVVILAVRVNPGETFKSVGLELREIVGYL